MDALTDSLTDDDCTDWQCPVCGRYNLKGFVNVLTGEATAFSRECDECGFVADHVGIGER